MPKKIPFIKYEALGNDFVVVDNADLPEPLSIEEAIQWCDRHFGVGADGVLLLSKHDDPSILARMDIVNSDGSVPEMCGNGLRCVALHLYEKHGLSSFQVETVAGLYPCEVSTEGAWHVSIPMGKASFGPREARVAERFWPGDGGALSLEIKDRSLVWHTASTGNPHAMTVVEDPEVPLLSLAVEYGPVASTHEAFLEGVNASWARVSEEGVELVVFERGAGLTLACGTGACAAVAMLSRLGLVPHNKAVPVDLPGGRLWARVSEEADLLMAGPARKVFQGLWNP